jgi:peptide/nickel transport system permease protein
MWRQVARLCLRRLALFVAVSVAGALAIGAAPGDPLAELALTGQASRTGVEAVRAARGLSDTPRDRIADALARLARLDLGDSTLHHQPVAPLVLPRLRRSLTLTVTALGLAWLLAGAAVLSQVAGRLPALGPLIGVGMAALQAIPDVVIAIAVLTILAGAGWTWGLGGQVTSAGMLGGSLVLAMVHLPTAWQHLHVALHARLGEPWMLGLRARGVPHRRRLWRHAVRASAAPLLAVAAVGFGTLLSAGLVVETLFGIPGLGAMMLDAMLARDVPLALGGVMASAAATLAILTLADILALRFDPRTQAAGGHA